MRIKRKYLPLLVTIGFLALFLSFFAGYIAKPQLVFAVTLEQGCPPGSYDNGYGFCTQNPPPRQEDPPPCQGADCCASGQVYENGGCWWPAPPPPPQCGSNQYVAGDGSSGNPYQCIDNPPAVVCGPGYYLDYWGRDCYPEGPASCGGGASLVGSPPRTWCECPGRSSMDSSGNCVYPPDPPSCPDGQHSEWWGTEYRCVEDPPPYEPPPRCTNNQISVSKTYIQRGEVIRVYLPGGYSGGTVSSSNTGVLEIGNVNDSSGGGYLYAVGKSGGWATISGSNFTESSTGNSCSLSGPSVNVSDPVTQSCPNGSNVDAMLVTDRSGSMTDYGKMDSTKSASKAFIDKFNPSSDQLGLASFSTNATLDYGLSNNFGQIKQKIDSLSPSGTTNIGDAIQAGNQGLDGGRSNKRSMVLLTDGLVNTPGYGDGNSQAVSWANVNTDTASNKGYKIFTIGLGNDVSLNFLADIAYKTGGRYYFSPSGGDLNFVYSQIANAICNPTENTPPPSGNAPSSPTANIYNTVTGKAVGLTIPCGSLLAKWSQVSGVTGYKVYNTTLNNNVGTVTGSSTLTYLFEPSNKTTLYSYAVSSYNGSGESSKTTAVGSPIAPTWPCGASLSGSNKDVVRVRGIDTPYDPQAVNDANVTAASPIAEGDIIRFAINVVNSGQKDIGTPLTVTDTMINLIKPSSGWKESVSCNNECDLSVQSYDQNSGVVTFVLTPKPGKVISPGEFWSIQMDTKTKVPAGTTATIFRVQNNATIKFKNPDNNQDEIVTSAWLKTPYILVFRDLATPEIREIQGN